MKTATEFKLIPIADVHESKHNPRRHYDGPQLAELAASIQQVGVLTPCLVRPNAKGFELAAGHRRYRAAKSIGLDQLPCLIRPMTDQEFLEVLTIENLQREDVHPLDEAKGYEALMAKPYKMPVEQIAEKVGRSVKYIYDRVKLLSLTQEAQRLFWDGMIEAGHAILLARLSPKEQAEVIGDKQAAYLNGGLFQAQHDLYCDEADGEEDLIKVRSVREVEDYIKRHIRAKSASVDAFLFPETAQQVQHAMAGKGKVVDITYEFLAHDDVRGASPARVLGERAWRRADGKDGSKTCDRAVLGFVVSGPGQGAAFPVCISKETCRIHWADKIKAREERAKKRERGGSAQSIADQDRKAREREAAEQAREEAERIRWQKAVPKLRELIAEKIRTMPIGSLLHGAIGKELYERAKDWQTTPTLAAMVPAGQSADTFLRHLYWVGSVSCLSYPSRARPILKALSLHPAKLLDQLAPVQTSAPRRKGKPGR